MIWWNGAMMQYRTSDAHLLGCAAMWRLGVYAVGVPSNSGVMRYKSNSTTEYVRFILFSTTGMRSCPWTAPSERLAPRLHNLYVTFEPFPPPPFRPHILHVGYWDSVVERQRGAFLARQSVLVLIILDL